MRRLFILIAIFFGGNNLKRKITKLAEQRHVLLQILTQFLHIHIPIEMHQPVAKADHSHHRLAKGPVKVACINQKLVDIPAFLGMAQLINRNDVGGNVGTALDSGLKSPFYGQLAGKINFELFQSNGLLLL